MTSRPEETPRPSRSSRFGRSLGLRLSLWLSLITALAFTAYAWVTVQRTSQHWQDAVQAGSMRFADLVLSATHHGMLLNRKSDVQYIVEAIASEPGVAGVRIYDKQGIVAFSGDTDEIGRQVDMQAQACDICHESTTPLEAVPDSGRVRVFEVAGGERLLGLIEPIDNHSDCSSASCHAHPPSQTVLGVLDVTMSLAQADALLAATRRQAIAAAVVMTLLVGLSSTLFVRRLVGRPVQRLTHGAERVACGDLTGRIEVDDRGEIGTLARTFNIMTEELSRARDELTHWSGRLERKVVEKTEELGRAQRQVVHMEKMASLGKLSATVAHELNNPLAGILNYARLVARDIRDLHLAEEQERELLRCLDLIGQEAARSGEIVRNLLLFARPSGGALVPCSAVRIVDWATMIVQHHLEMNRVELELQHDPGDDRIVCDPDQIRQALVAMLVNGIEAMPDGGTLTVRVRPGEDDLGIEIVDSGNGIADQDLPHIFEPFFSTKEASSGVGLGLSVVFGIVKRHDGTIDVDSELGRGTCFRLTLPRSGPGTRIPHDVTARLATAEEAKA